MLVILLLSLTATTTVTAEAPPTVTPRRNHICLIEEVRAEKEQITVGFADGRRVRRQRGEATVEFVIDKGGGGNHVDQNDVHHVSAVPARLGDKIVRADTMPEDTCTITIAYQDGVLGAAGEASTYTHIAGLQSYKEFVPAISTP